MKRIIRSIDWGYVAAVAVDFAIVTLIVGAVVIGIMALPIGEETLLPERYPIPTSTYQYDQGSYPVDIEVGSTSIRVEVTP